MLLLKIHFREMTFMAPMILKPPTVFVTHRIRN